MTETIKKPESTQNLPELLTRGVEQIMPNPESLATELKKRTIRVYLGIDPSGAFLTLGHSVVLRKLQQFADAGHQVIMLIGNGTVRIGDPTGRDSSRPELSDEKIQENFKDWKRQASKILDFNKIEIRYNGDWLDKLTFTDLVKLMAKTTVQQLTERDMFQERIKNGLPIFGHELLYPLLQGYDSVAMDVDLEIGGSDQLFNMMVGRTLQKVYNNREKWVLATPIINGSDGRKMSKSFGNYVALIDEPNDMYGKLMSIIDEQIIQYFTLLTDVPLTEIARMEAQMTAGENPMQFKKLLAKTITTMYHTVEAAEAAEKQFEETVQGSQLPSDMPEIVLSKNLLSILSIMEACLPELSKTELRRLIEQRAVTVLPMDTKVTDAAQDVAVAEGTILKVGKRKYFRLVTKA